MGITLITKPEFLGRTIKRFDGAILRDGRLTSETLQCVVCSAHFEMEEGSGKQRGWNTKLKGFTCGNPACNLGLPQDRYLDMLERGITPFQAVHEYETGIKYN